MYDKPTGTNRTLAIKSNTPILLYDNSTGTN
jgi:hypothetical protein